jgi:hypothetical protein
MDQMQQKEELQAKLARDTHEPNGRDTDQAFRRENITNLQRLLTGARQRRLDIDLEAAAAQARIEQAGDDRAEAAKARTDLAVAKAKQKVLDDAREEFSQELTKARLEDKEHTQDTSNFQALEAQIKQYHDKADRLWAQKEQLRIETESATQRVTVLQQATE